MRRRARAGAATLAMLLLAMSGIAAGSEGAGHVAPTAATAEPPVRPPALIPPMSRPLPAVTPPPAQAAPTESVPSAAPDTGPVPSTIPTAPPAGPKARPAPGRTPLVPAPGERGVSAGHRPLPPPTRAGAGCTPRHTGPGAGRAEVEQALTEAAARTYWPVSAPQIRVPANLVKAVAWQESGWQSSIVACDGGIGLMQVMPETAVFINQRFEKAYDVHDYRDNALLGANYLAWLTRYIGDLHFGGDYDLDPGRCATQLDSCLLNAVIAAYNFGPEAVAPEAGLKIPNPRYVRNVRALMTDCECLALSTTRP